MRTIIAFLVLFFLMGQPTAEQPTSQDLHRFAAAPVESLNTSRVEVFDVKSGKVRKVVQVDADIRMHAVRMLNSQPMPYPGIRAEPKGGYVLHYLFSEPIAISSLQLVAQEFYVFLEDEKTDLTKVLAFETNGEQRLLGIKADASLVRRSLGL